MDTFIGYPIRLPGRSRTLDLEILREWSIIHQIPFQKIRSCLETRHLPHHIQINRFSKIYCHASPRPKSDLTLSWHQTRREEIKRLPEYWSKRITDISCLYFYTPGVVGGGRNSSRLGFTYIPCKKIRRSPRLSTINLRDMAIA